ncbi:hypothetical protein AURDEDRAFT_113314 [Auricularia subglabra TFB-10046 SS5]|nr:hypothetical protein AURDEDRAFT_113314 [Auricularia subglabra TFB-10046 SS5]
MTNELIAHLAHGLQRLRSTPPRVIASPSTQPRRAAVALIIRVVPDPSYPLPEPSTLQPSLSDFFALDWVNAPGARAEVLFLKRAASAPSAPGDVSGNSEAHVSFPGGRTEEGDENGLYTAMRQTWEEIGLDLAERDFVCVGQLDDREITTSLGKRLLMILSPFVFLQVTPTPAPTDPLPEIALHWIPLSKLASNKPTWSSVTADISVRMAPRYPILRRVIRLLLGSMKFAAIVLNDNPKGKGRARREDVLKLWGLTLGMTLDLLALLQPPHRPKLPLEPDADGLIGIEMAPSMASVFPRFSYPDVNFWIWVFGRRYRAVIRGWEASLRAGAAGAEYDRRVNWIGQAVNAFYGAVRRALVVVIVLRAIGLVFALGFGAWWVFA